jgi:hypothetical protein
MLVGDLARRVCSYSAVMGALAVRMGETKCEGMNLRAMLAE